jgi:hypothetical protein
MIRNGSRTITVNKKNLIEKIKENKKNHIIEYEKAIIAYKKEALKQLKELTKLVEDGATDIKLNLTKPINATENYDNLIMTFEWEVNDEVELTQAEFNECVLDQTYFAQEAKMSNMAYTMH